MRILREQEHRGSRACRNLAKAMEDIRESGAGVEEPSGVGEVDVQKVVVGPGEVLLGPESAKGQERAHLLPVLPGSDGWPRGRVGGGHISDGGWDNITQPERRAPASSMHHRKERNANEC